MFSKLLRLNPRIFRGVHFTRRFFKQLAVIRRFDRHLPYQGEIGESFGFHELSLSKESIPKIRSLYQENLKSSNNLTIDSSKFEVFNELFEQLSKPILDYLGPEAKIDGVNFFIRSNKDSVTPKGFSTYWHTDNVGARLKVFVCFEGDGSNPTIISPPQKRPPSINYQIYSYFIELLRWLNFANRFRLSNEIYLAHRTGSIFLLDTQVLHRGSWENSISTRHLLQFEFSNPKKHDLMQGVLEGPIGTKEYNTFKFHECLLKSSCFSNFLDKKRVKRIGEYLEYKS
ncbi:hypothetical protein [Prochlorococcus sp. MIT 1307]|uniref:hypothetical protein n=1 Tax=Prochlorococcus sp. MIT 1307 TaxID=3096219 RepID=UPI002A765650|nr:hypothetical protein [Prochlorococcus sp. MIT 1307]